MTEKQLQDQVIQLAKMHGWMIYHTYDSRRSEPGYPDLTMVKDGRIIFAELKNAKGRVSKAQEVWLAALGKCEGTETYLWRPGDWDQIADKLSGR